MSKPAVVTADKTPVRISPKPGNVFLYASGTRRCVILGPADRPGWFHVAPEKPREDERDVQVHRSELTSLQASVFRGRPAPAWEPLPPAPPAAAKAGRKRAPGGAQPPVDPASGWVDVPLFDIP